jgi:hypothetical protein
MSIKIQTEMTGIYKTTDLSVTKVEEKPGNLLF